MAYILKARGIDHSEVKATRVRKSVGTERTFSTDVNDDEEILQKYGTIWQDSRTFIKLQKSGSTVTVKLKTYQYETFSKQRSLREAVSRDIDIYNVTYDLYNDLKDPDVPIRLIGVTVGNLEQSRYENMTIYDFIER